MPFKHKIYDKRNYLETNFETSLTNINWESFYNQSNPKNVQFFQFKYSYSLEK